MAGNLRMSKIGPNGFPFINDVFDSRRHRFNDAGQHPRPSCFPTMYVRGGFSGMNRIGSDYQLGCRGIQGFALILYWQVLPMVNIR